MPDRPRYSRFLRLPGLYRIGERRPADVHAEPQLLPLYLPGRTLDQAEMLAMRAGGGTIQAYCEALLGDAIEAEDRRVRDEMEVARHGPLESLEELAEDPENLAEWAAIARDRLAPPSDPEIPLAAGAASNSVGDGLAAREVVLRHAAMGADDPYAMLTALRGGAAILPAAAEELLDALNELETCLLGADRIDRRLAYALHRLAFEGQVQITDAYQAADPASIEALRRVQEAVDRVLSGEDIRYYSDRPPSIEP